jgi:hypothetical protein
VEHGSKVLQANREMDIVGPKTVMPENEGLAVTHAPLANFPSGEKIIHPMVILYVNTAQKASIQVQELTSALSARQEHQTTLWTKLLAMNVQQASIQVVQELKSALCARKEKCLG